MTLMNFLVGLPVMVLCLIVQTALTFWCVRHYVRYSAQTQTGQGFWTGIRPLIVITLAMMVCNLLQIALWALLFVLLGEFGERHDAIYHSAVNFTSLGYGDIVMSKDWKMLGPLEAANGVMMLGMTAAAMMAILQHMIKVQQDALFAKAEAALRQATTDSGAAP
ncbi:MULTISPECIES: ion channel [unclassified Variovorax]|uniref:ion channel n=1 Tax=unclassified Variovorax TaxID=663243 RepID=UPI001BD6022A|nr:MULTISPECIES: ion channel [unclassified Variovorax]